MGRKVAIKANRASESLAGLGNHIKNQRKQMKLSATELAFAANISRTTLHKIEAGDAGVTAGAYAVVLNVLGEQLAVVDDLDVDNSEAQILVSNYEQLKRVAWQIKPTAKLQPIEAWSIYKRNWHYLDQKAIKKSEKDLIENLRAKFGATNGIQT